MIKIASWNVCLGLTQKKLEISRKIVEENIDICCLQETEIKSELKDNELTFSGYCIETENNDTKKRVCIYVGNGIKYRRRMELEGINNHLIIIDIQGEKSIRLINLYRSHKPRDNFTPREKFANQLTCIQNASTENMIVTGDFNLDYAKYHELDYVNKNLCDDLINYFDPMSFIQLINFPTWSRIVQNILKESTLDHIYTNDSTLVENITFVTPLGGDHKIIIFSTLGTCSSPKPILKRDWKFYSKDSLIEKLNLVNWQIEADDVQSYWNIFETKLLKVVDELVPYKTFVNDQKTSDFKPQFIKSILQKRKRLLKCFNKDKLIATKIEIKLLDVQVRRFFRTQKRNSIRRKIVPNNSKTLWDAVKTAKNLNLAQIPENLTLTDIKVPQKCIPEAFACFFSEKVESIGNEVVMNENVYNGKCKVTVANINFMSENDVEKCIKDIKIKNNEGFDRIPQRILVEGCASLLPPLSILFQKIYLQKQLPEQWLTSKIIPIHKRGDKSKIENYRPISNLCSASKIFEKLILKRIHQIQEDFNIDLTGNAQHGFKKNKSTSTAGLTIQSLLSRALDKNNYAIMASLDLSAAFDVVNVKLLIK